MIFLTLLVVLYKCSMTGLQDSESVEVLQEYAKEWTYSVVSGAELPE